MRLRSFSIRNYKSIIDSGKCSFDADMIVLAGKNEAGKTATLEALRDFDRGTKTFKKSVTPVGTPEAVPSLRLVFEIDRIDGIIDRSAVRHLAKAAQISWDQPAENYICDKGLSLLKTQHGEECVYSIGEDLKAVVRKPGCPLEEEEEVRLVNEILKVIPRFVLLGDFSTKLPASISLNSAQNNSAVLAFLEEAGLDRGKLEATKRDPRARRIILSRAAERINSALEEVLEGVKLVAEVKGDRLVFWIEDLQNKQPFKPQERSKGLQWLLSCYLGLSSRRDHIVLIDEPALYLHPKAQRTVLTLLEKASRNPTQIIYSTHSPFLINPDKLGRVKLVVRDASGTKIKKFYDTETDTDTLTPITKAIGLSLAGAFSIASKYNVVVEGISDYYYLQALRLVVKHEFDDFAIFPVIGADNIRNVASLLIGLEVRFVVVLDNDVKGSKVKQSLAESLALEDGQIILIPVALESSIEDMFTRDDFNDHVLSALGRRNEDPTLRNSEFLRSPKKSAKVPLDDKGRKVIPAKTLYEAISTHPENIKFSDQTIQSFSTLFSQISSYFKSHQQSARGR